MTKRAVKKRFLKHRALISRQRVKSGLQGLLDEDRRATAVIPSLLPSAPVAGYSNLVSYPALIPVDTNKAHNRECSHPLHPKDPRQLNRPQVFSFSLPEPLLPVASLPRSDPSKPITNSGLAMLAKQIPVKQSRPRIKARPADPLILQATQRKATDPVPIRPPQQTTSGLISQGLGLPQHSAIFLPPAPLSTVIARITKPHAPRASLLIAAIGQKKTSVFPKPPLGTTHIFPFSRT